MAICPKCQTELDAEFGMTQCPSCGAFSFIAEDGIARAPEDEARLADDDGPVGFEPVPFETPEIFEEPPVAFDPPSGFDAPLSPEAPLESFGMDSFQSVTPNEDEPVENSGISDVSTRDSNPESEHPSMAFGPASDPLNLNEFANSEVSSGRDGPLLFRVLIEGIDTKEIRESIREVLNDDRFRLESSTIMSRVSKGNLVIDGLSPVKASILVNRIKRLPITIRWEQYAITEANP